MGGNFIKFRDNLRFMDMTDIKIGILEFIRFCLQTLKENPRLVTLIVIFVFSLFVVQSITHQITVADSTTIHDSFTVQAEYNRGVVDSTKVSDSISVTVERADGTIERVK